MRQTNRIQRQATNGVRRSEAALRLVACVEAISYALLSRRMLSTIAICSFVWMASLWLAAAIALAQESPSNESGITVTQPAPSSLASAETSNLVLSMVDRNELESGTLQNLVAQPANRNSAGQQSAEKVLIPVDSRGSEYTSLAALASAPPSSLINAAKGKGAGDTDAASPSSANKPIVYQLGAFNLVINGLPNSFSVSSAGSSVAGAR